MNALVNLFNVLFNLAGTLTRTNEIFTEFNARAERSLGMDKAEEPMLHIEHVEPAKRKSK